MRRFRYCPSCGKKVKRAKEKNAEVCISCGKFWFHNPEPSNSVFLVNERGEILLGKRKYAPKKGYWDAIGGFAESGESMEVSLRREVREEIGIALKGIQYFGSYPDEYAYKGNTYTTLVFFYVAHVSSKQKFFPADDVEEVRFFPMKNMPWSHLAFPSLKQALRDYQKRQKR